MDTCGYHDLFHHMIGRSLGRSCVTVVSAHSNPYLGNCGQLPTLQIASFPLMDSKMEKSQNLLVSKPKKNNWVKYIPLILLSGLSVYHLLPVQQGHITSQQCIQVAPLKPTNITPAMDDAFATISSETYFTDSVGRMSGAVQIPSVSFDDLGPVGKDKRWEIFYEFSAFLNKTFPLVHQHLKLERVNTHGLLYTWQGTSDLKPTLLMAHQDVVPVAEKTLSAWKHPAFSGYFDGKTIWGRGSSDCKNQLIAIMESLELLVAANFTPSRTILISFGFDEEISGNQGAATLSKFILEKYGEDSIAVVVDEGMGFEKMWGTWFASPGVGEKGYIDVEITVNMPGGHSSVPSPHTSIGVISNLLVEIENDKYTPILAPVNPYLGQLQCGLAHAENFPRKFARLLKKGSSLAKLAKEAAKQSPFIKYLMTTSVALDVINGGVKVNALPEQVTAIVNHRVNIGSSTKDVKTKITKHVEKIAHRYNLAINHFDEEKKYNQSAITLRGINELQPAPITPTDPHKSAYGVISGTTRALYGEEVILSPGLMTGNTDTKYYWPLTRDIFRFNPSRRPEDDDQLGGIHTINENMPMESHLSTVKWFFTFIVNMNEADLP